MKTGARRPSAIMLGVPMLMAACADRPLDLPLGVADMTTLDMAPDLASSTAVDLAVPDLAGADMALVDLNVPPDLATFDLAGVDLLGADMATPRDLATPRDMATPRDLAPPRDLATADMASTVCASYVVSTLTGNGIAGFVDGSGGPNGTTRLNWPVGVAFDQAGNVILADSLNERIRKIAPDGTTTTIAGSGAFGSVDGAARIAQFSNPAGIAIDAQGNIMVADYAGARIRKVAPDGTTSTLAGNGTGGWADGTGGRNGTAEFNFPVGGAFDSAGNLIVPDAVNNRIRKVAPDGTTTTLTGNGIFGWVDGTGGPNGTTEFKTPYAVAINGAGTIYISDWPGVRVRRVAPDGTTTTLTGNGGVGLVDGTGGANGTTELTGPIGLAVDGTGIIYLADYGGNRIRKVAPDGTTVTIAGRGVGYADGNGCEASFNGPIEIALSGKQLVVAEVRNNRIRSIQLP
jgi:hypothetical protein